MALFVDIEKNLGDFQLKVAFEAGNEAMALLGASGCGKSLTLRCIAGIETPDRGRIVLDGVTLFDSEKKINRSPQERHTGLMFQNYALFPNMTVLENIRTGAKRERDAQKRQQAVADVMERFDLTALANHYPAQLSGGQQQRTALARILVSDPRILLLDEPFSALDSHLRFRLEQELRQVIAGFGKTVLLVSHDRDEVYRLSHSIAVMHQGRVEVVGSKERVFAAPHTRNAAILTGCKNLSSAAPMGNGQIMATDWGFPLTVSPDHGTISAVGVRARDILPGEGENSVRCRVLEEIENPFSYTVLLSPLAAAGRTPLAMELDKEQWALLRRGEITVHIPTNSLLLLQDGQ